MTCEDFDSFYIKYQDVSIQAAFYMVNDMDIAEDISQEVFIKLYLMSDEVDSSNTIRVKALIKKMTINRSIDYLRKASTKREFLGYGCKTGEKYSDEYNPETKMLCMEKERYIKIALERFRETNPINYDIFIKTKLYEFSSQQIAHEYNITANNVNNRNKRSRIWINKELEKISRQLHVM